MLCTYTSEPAFLVLVSVFLFLRWTGQNKLELSPLSRIVTHTCLVSI